MTLVEALGRTLAQPAVAQVDLPGFANSAMDGYAVRAEDCAGASESAPVELPVVGDIPAGDTRSLRLEPGTTWRIMTGAPLPEGADAIVPVELSDGGTLTARLRLAPEAGLHVRSLGEDVRAGEEILPAGVVLNPGRLALLALSAGLSNRQIACELCVSPGTVKTHLANIYSKLDVNSRVQAVAEARMLKLI